MFVAARAKTGVKLGLAGWQIVGGLSGVETCAPLKRHFGETSAENPERRGRQSGIQGAARQCVKGRARNFFVASGDGALPTQPLPADLYRALFKPEQDL